MKSAGVPPPLPAESTEGERYVVLAVVFGDCYQTDGVRAALMNDQVSFGGGSHVPDDADSGGDGPALELLGFRVEPDERIWPLM